MKTLSNQRAIQYCKSSTKLHLGLTLCLFVGWLLLTPQRTFAQSSEAQAKVLRSEIWPTHRRFFLGFPFLYRIELKVPKGFTPQPPKNKVIGVAQIRGKINIKKKLSAKDTFSIHIPLSVYRIRNFGKQEIPAFSIPLTHPSKDSVSATIPKQVFQIQAKHAQTVKFQSPQDPHIPVLRAHLQKLKESKKSKIPMPSHEWQNPSFTYKPKNQGKMWWWIPVAALILISLFFFLRKKKPEVVIEEQIDPYDDATKALQALLSTSRMTQTPSKEERNVHYKQLSKVLRQYLTDREIIPAISMTASELVREFYDQEPPPPWSSELLELLQESESIRFSDHVQHEPLENSSNKGIQCLDAIEAWFIKEQAKMLHEQLDVILEDQ